MFSTDLGRGLASVLGETGGLGRDEVVEIIISDIGTLNMAIYD